MSVAREIDCILLGAQKTRLETSPNWPELTQEHILLLLVTLAYDHKARACWTRLRKHMGIVANELTNKARETFLRKMRR